MLNNKRVGFSLLSLYLFVVIANLLSGRDSVQAVTIETQTKLPGSCQSVSNGSVTHWTNPNDARFKNDGVYARAALGFFYSESNDLRCSQYNFQLPSNAVVLGIRADVNRRRNRNNVTEPNVRLMKNLSPIGVATTSDVAWSSNYTVASFGGDDYLWGTTWTASEVNADGFGLSYNVKKPSWSQSANIDVDYIELTVRYQVPRFSQVAYQWFSNTDSIAVGSALAGVNQGHNPDAIDLAWRLRTLLHLDIGSQPANSKQFRLQYARRGADGVCDASASDETYADVGSDTPIRFFDNPSVAHGATPTPDSSLSHQGHTIISQQYAENALVSLSSTVAGSDDALYDFALSADPLQYGQTFCLRVINQDGSLLDGYDSLPEITLPPLGTLSVDFIDNQGLVVNNPTFSFSGLPPLANCQVSQAIFGSSSGNRLQIRRDGYIPTGWSVSIAPIDGTTSVWSSDAGEYYDFNDPSGSPAGCANGLDGDLFAGQLSIARGTTQMTTNCNLSGLSYNLGTASFSSGVNDAITLVNAAANTMQSTDCWYNLFNTSLNQTIPASQAPGIYSLDMVVTITAQ